MRHCSKRKRHLKRDLRYHFKERHYKNLQYQRELLDQIEQKRKEAEERKVKEIEADERLTRYGQRTCMIEEAQTFTSIFLHFMFGSRKVEAQLRSVRLQDEIEKAALTRKREYVKWR